MFFGNWLSGGDLPEGSLCLSFDDGPGERSLALAELLAGRGIAATFFVVGSFVAAKEEHLERIAALGHLVANHSLNHPQLPSMAEGEAARDILAAAALLPDSSSPLKLLRPPYGLWDWELAGRLNWSAAHQHIGPLMWDIDGQDWLFWRNGQGSAECAATYLEKIRAAGRGIVLLHDSSFDEDIRAASLTLETVELMLDTLTAEGYRFLRIDELPQVQEAARIGSVVALRSAAGTYLAPVNGGGGSVRADRSQVGPWEPLGLVELEAGRIALRCLSGHYLSPQQGGGGAVLANGPNIGHWEPLTPLPLAGDWLALRSPSGHYLSTGTDASGGDGNLVASATEVGVTELFQLMRPPQRGEG